MKITKYKPSRRILSLKNLWRVIYEEDIYDLNHKPPRIWLVDNYNVQTAYLSSVSVQLVRRKKHVCLLYSCNNLRETFESLNSVEFRETCRAGTITSCYTLLTQRQAFKRNFLGIVSVSVRPYSTEFNLKSGQFL